VKTGEQGWPDNQHHGHYGQEILDISKVLCLVLLERWRSWRSELGSDLEGT